MLVVRWRKYTWHIASVVVVCFIVGVNTFIGATPFVDNSGNTAGFVFGAVLCLGFLLIRRRVSGPGWGVVQRTAARSVGKCTGQGWNLTRRWPDWPSFC
jgi:hypothetical protein